MRWHIAASALAAALITFFSIQSALACSVSACRGNLFGYAEEQTPIPPNLGGIFFGWEHPTSTTTGRPDVPSAVVHVETGERLSFEVESVGQLYRIIFEDDLLPGATYRVEGVPSRVCMGSGPGPSETRDFQFETSDQFLPPPPQSLGTLQIGPVTQENVFLAGGSACIYPLDAVQFRLSIDEAQVGPWAPYLHYRTVYSFSDPTLETDVQRHRPTGHTAQMLRHGESWRGRGQDLFYHSCQNASEDQNEAVTVAIRMEADIPGTSTTITSEIVEMELRCGTDADTQRDDL